MSWKSPRARYCHQLAGQRVVEELDLGLAADHGGARIARFGSS